MVGTELLRQIRFQTVLWKENQDAEVGGHCGLPLVGTV